MSVKIRCANICWVCAKAVEAPRHSFFISEIAKVAFICSDFCLEGLHKGANCIVRQYSATPSNSAEEDPSLQIFLQAIEQLKTGKR